MFILSYYQLLVMSGTNNQYEPNELYKKWLEQNQQMLSEFQKGFERVTQQASEMYQIPDAWKRMIEQMEIISRQTNLASQMNQGARQFTDMMWNNMMPWQQNQYASLPNLFTTWSVFKTAIGSNGRISIPEAERNVLGLAEGDLVQVIVLPIKRKEVKK